MCEYETKQQVEAALAEAEFSLLCITSDYNEAIDLVEELKGRLEVFND